MPETAKVASIAINADTCQPAGTSFLLDLEERIDILSIWAVLCAMITLRPANQFNRKQISDWKMGGQGGHALRDYAPEMAQSTETARGREQRLLLRCMLGPERERERESPTY